MINLYLYQSLGPRAGLVISQTNPTGIPVMEFALGNVFQTRIFTVDGQGGYDPNSGNGGYSLRVAIGIPGQAPAWVNTNWNAFNTSGVKGWAGLLATNTDAIQDLFTSLASDPINCSLEITIIDSNGFPVTDLLTPIRIWNRVAPDDSLVVAPSPNNTDGEFPIPNGVDTVLVTGLGLSVMPRRVVASIRKPAGGFNLGGLVVADSITTDGFRVDLTGVTDASTYKVDFLLIF